MTAQLSMFAPAPEPAPAFMRPPRYGWEWKACDLLRDTQGGHCEPREGVWVSVERETVYGKTGGGRLVYAWTVMMGVGSLRTGEALTFEGAVEAARKVVDDG